jgi:hypothetical protein
MVVGVVRGVLEVAEVVDLVLMPNEGGGGDGEGRYFVVVGRQRLDVRDRSEGSWVERRLPQLTG